jgi:esterase/lipase superfamily enzyme
MSEELGRPGAQGALMSRSPLVWSFVLIPLAATLGCAPALMPTPNLYASGAESLFGELTPALKTSTIDVLYATDRAPSHDGAGGVRYGHERSTSVGYGSVKVEIGEGLSWDEVVRHSVEGSPPLRRPRLRVTSIQERGRFPKTPYQFRIVAPGEVGLAPSAVAERDASLAAVREELASRLARTARNEVFLFIHGVNTSFETAAIQTAEGWHFLGREGVPLLYSWPARSSSPLSYAYDRESGEFTIFHLKQTLRALAAIPEVEKIHVIAHSRGADVATTALRELALAARAAGVNPRAQLKVDNLVLIAADLDFGVVMQRLVAETLGSAVGRVTVYGYSSDNAMRAANALLRSQLRVGQIQSQELSDEQREMLQQVTNLDIVSYDGRVGGQFGHFYFLQNPAVSSDILALVRFGLPPGAGVRQGLKRVEPRSNFWTIDDDYLRAAVAAAEAPGS